MAFVRYALFYLLQWTWGLPQNLAGLVYCLFLGRQPRRFYHGAVITYYENHPWLARRGNFSLGMFLFIDGTIRPGNRAKLNVHEYGHTIQSLLYGPLFVLLVALPSTLWLCCYRAFPVRYRRRRVRYCDRYPENQANRLGAWVTGEPPIDW